jgi:arylsulfatase A-like enzyme
MVDQRQKGLLMHRLGRRLVASVAVVALAVASAAGAAPDESIDHSVYRPARVLPRPAQIREDKIGRTLESSTPPYYQQDGKSPPGAPNVLLILTDDVGYGASSTFGGPIPTPTFDAVASRGERYTQFHTSALCAPTRAAMLTGRNPHEVGFGAITEMGTGYPGYTTILPKSAATIGEVLRQNGFATAWFGKNHNTPEWEQSAVGPFDRWPTGLGFDYFYGFMGGATSQWNPLLFENTTPVEKPPEDKNYILDHDLANHAIGWLRQLNASNPDKPFLLYYAPGTSHSPHHAPADWIARFRGEFDQGWDVMREQSLARQKALGVVPPDTRLTPRPADIPAWDSLSPERKRLAARMMEVYAAALAYSDDQIGQVLSEVAAEGKLDNTLVIFIQGDNGASGEGGIDGSTNDIAAINGMRPDVATMLKEIGTIGGPDHYNNYPVGWAWAMNTPFQWTKQVASHFGGTRNGMVISWPKAMRQPGGIRQQFHHVADIAPTIYQAVGIVPPTQVNGVLQQPLDGISMGYSFNDASVPSRRHSQIFEMQGNAAIYQDGWMASSTPTRSPWVFGGKPSLPTEGHWELYDVRRDYSQFEDLSAKDPARLAALKAAFWKAAAAGKVLPIDNRSFPRWNSSNRPSLLGDRTRFTYFPQERRITGGAFPDLTGRSWRVSATVTIGAQDTQGTILANGNQFNGWSLIMRAGRAEVLYRTTDDDAGLTRLTADRALTPGQHVVTVELRDGGQGKPGTLHLSIDGANAGEAALPRTIPVLINADPTIGRSLGAIDDSYSAPFRFTGTIEKIDVDLIGDKGPL